MWFSPSNRRYLFFLVLSSLPCSSKLSANQSLILRAKFNFLLLFLKVSLMKKLRHPNILLFMGVVTSPQRLCIVTEFLPRFVLDYPFWFKLFCFILPKGALFIGWLKCLVPIKNSGSLFRLLQRNTGKLDWRRRVHMALDIVSFSIYSTIFCFRNDGSRSTFSSFHIEYIQLILDNSYESIVISCFYMYYSFDRREAWTIFTIAIHPLFTETWNRRTS